MDIDNFHYDQEAIYCDFLEFQKINEGVEVTEQDLLEAWRAAKEKTQYFELDNLTKEMEF